MAAPRPARAFDACSGTPRVVCGIAATGADDPAVERACELAGPSGHVALVSVIHSRGLEEERGDAIAPARAASALERAMRRLRALGVRSSVYILHNQDPAEVLVNAAAGADYLVVGSRDGENGSVSAAALKRARVPVVIVGA